MTALARLIVTTALALGSVSVAAAGGGQARTVPPARRIVSLVPSVTEMLFAIGAGPSVVAVSSFDTYPAAVRTLPRVGGLVDPDYERILTLRPDLVVTYGSQTELEARLGRAGIRAFSYVHGNVASVTQAMRALGALTGHDAEAETAAQRLTAEFQAVRDRVAGRPRPRVMLVFGRDPLALRQVYASAGRGFMHDLLGIAGAVNVFADVDRENIQPSSETMLARAPDVIVELRAAGPPSAEIQARERAVWAPLSSVPAVRTGRILFLYGDYFVMPGPRLGRAAEALARAVHPEAFR